MDASSVSRPKLYSQLLGQLRPYGLHVGALLFLSILSTPLALLLPLPLKIAVDSIAGTPRLPGFLQSIVPPTSTDPSSLTLLLVAGGLLVAIALLDQLQKLVSLVLGTYTGEKLILSLRSQLFGHAQRLSLSYHDSKGTADAIYRIHSDAAAIQWVVVFGGVPLLSAALMMAGMLYVTARIDWQLALVGTAFAPVILAITWLASQRLREGWEAAKVLESAAFSVLQEVLTGLRVVKAFGQEEREQRRFAERSGEGMRARIRMASFEGTFGLLVGVTTAMGTAVVIYVGGRHIQSGLITLGDLVLVIVYLLQLYAPVQAIAKSVTTLQSSLAGTRRALALLDEAPDVVERPHARPLVRAAGAVAFRNVSFAYDGHARVLHDLSFEVPPGTRLGIIGATGAGKTTLVNLLSRFYDPTAGQILLDGIDLREYRLQHLRRQFAIVLQEPVLFSATVAENIAYARPDASEQDLVESARSANAHDFIAGLPDGYQTLVGERGMRLSGGERQRIALARAFLKDAPILILDEPTSSIDVETEAVILEAMWRLMQGRTAFLIAHRITTLAPCDACLELEGGRLARMAPLSSPAGALRMAPHGRSDLARS